MFLKSRFPLVVLLAGIFVDAAPLTLKPAKRADGDLDPSFAQKLGLGGVPIDGTFISLEDAVAARLAGKPAESAIRTAPSHRKVTGARIIESDYYELGQGWDTLSEKAVGICLRPPGTEDDSPVGWTLGSGGDSFVSASFSKELSTQDSMKALEVSGEVSVQLSSFQADGKARYANDIATSSTSITFVYFVEYFADSEVISMTSTADFDGEDPASRKKYLTPLGRSAFERLSTNPNSWREDCGDSVLQKKIRGGKVFITFSVIFKTVDDKTSLSAEINGKFKDSVSLKANVEFSNSVKQSDAKVKFNVFQYGGDPTSLLKIFSTDILSCEITNVTACQSLFERAFNYVGGDINAPIEVGGEDYVPQSLWQQGFFKADNGTWTPDPAKYTTFSLGWKDYREFNIKKINTTSGVAESPADLSAEPPLIVMNYRKKLADYFDETLKSIRTITSLITQGRYDNTQLNAMKKKFDNNLDLLTVPITSCIQKYNLAGDGSECKEDYKNFLLEYYDSTELSELIGFGALTKAYKEAAETYKDYVGDAVDEDPVVLRSLYANNTVVDWEVVMPKDFARPLAIEDKPTIRTFTKGAIIKVPTFKNASVLWDKVYDRFAKSILDEAGLPVMTQFVDRGFVTDPFLNFTANYILLELRENIITGPDATTKKAGIFWGGNPLLDAALVNGQCYTWYDKFRMYKDLGLPYEDQVEDTPSSCQFDLGFIYIGAYDSKGNPLVRPIHVYGDIYLLYARDYFENTGDIPDPETLMAFSSLGKPTSDQTLAGNALIVEFENGFILQNSTLGSSVLNPPQMYFGSRAAYVGPQNPSQREQSAADKFEGWKYILYKDTGFIYGEYNADFIRRRLAIPGTFGTMFNIYPANYPQTAAGPWPYNYWWTSDSSAFGNPVDFRSVGGTLGVFHATNGVFASTWNGRRGTRAFNITGVPFQYWRDEGGMDGPFGVPISVTIATGGDQTIKFQNSRGYFLQIIGKRLDWCISYTSGQSYTNCQTVCEDVKADPPKVKNGRRFEYFSRTVSSIEDGARLVKGSNVIGVQGGVPTVIWKDGQNIFIKSLDKPNSNGDLVQLGVTNKGFANLERSYYRSTTPLTDSLCYGALGKVAAGAQVLLGTLENNLPGICIGVPGNVTKLNLVGPPIAKTVSGSGDVPTDGLPLATSSLWGGSANAESIYGIKSFVFNVEKGVAVLRSIKVEDKTGQTLLPSFATTNAVATQQLVNAVAAVNGASPPGPLESLLLEQRSITLNFSEAIKPEKISFTFDLLSPNPTFALKFVGSDGKVFYIDRSAPANPKIYRPVASLVDRLIRSGDVVLRHFYANDGITVSEVALVWNDAQQNTFFTSPQYRKYVLYSTGNANAGTVVSLYE